METIVTSDPDVALYEHYTITTEFLKPRPFLTINISLLARIIHKKSEDFWEKLLILRKNKNDFDLQPEKRQ
ncbi:MAG: hypothetical protein ONB44_21825 [candidate division KSB1 bacterium]|nr:hypothetical protein [candidate division KSB1 bacterium]